MAHLALKRVSYFGQFGILIGFVGAGLVIASIASLIPLLTQPGMGDIFKGNAENIMDKLFVPENAGILRFVQFISALFLFFIPAVVYAKVCHKRSFAHLGFKHKVTAGQGIVVIVLMLACLPLVGMLSELTEMLPFSEATMKKFKLAEEEYAKQISVIGRMDNFLDFLISLFMLAILPAVFEETLFRGAAQNLLSRWFKMPILAIIITSIIFSAVHFSYLGFLSRLLLGFVLGWVYYRTGNLWLSIIGHVTNNAAALIVLYIMKLKDPNIDLNKADPDFPFWLGFVGLATVVLLLIGFDRVSQYQIKDPGKEQLMVDETNNPFDTSSPQLPPN
jgi:membrane protease YdiL (CAAX protease family)